nr:triose-phosphate isomerase [Candidatus Omnitrophota bacterium]
MNTGKSINKIISFLLALIFVSTNTAYSSDKTLRVPLQTKRVEEFLGRVTEKAQALKRATEAVRITVIGGNWKMEVTSKEEAEALLKNIIESIKDEDISGTEVVVGVPIAFMDHLSGILRSAEANEENLKGKIKIAAQNIAGAKKGALTGRTSISQVKDLGATYVIIGHSEQRRDKSEKLISTENEAINNKVQLALKEGLVPIVCVGESLDERTDGKTNSIVEDMIRRAFAGLNKEQVSKLIIAYEPVWAIGIGKTAATPQQAEEVLRLIRRLILDMFDEDTASKVRIIYGGSVKPDNIAGLMDKSIIPDNDGALVGGASLKADSFIGIVKGVQTVFADSQGVKVTGNTQFRIGYQPATDVKELLKNLKGVLEFDASGNVVITNEDKLRSETIDYLAKEAALNSNDDIKAAAQFLIRSAAISLGIIPASINDFYMARKNDTWKDMTVPAVNIRTDGYETARQVFRVVKEQKIGAIILELAKSETRYSGQSVSEFTTVGFAAAIKEGYTGQIFFQGDHYQVDQKKYAKEPNKEIDTLKRFIRESILAGEYNIDLDPSTLVNEEALDEIVVFENNLVDKYLKGRPELAQGLDESGLKALRHKLIDELPLTNEQETTLDALYERLHRDTAKVTMEFMRYIRGLEKELLDGKITISIGIEERHIDNPKHKNNPSTVKGSIALAQKILKMCTAEGLVGPSKIALQTGTMHGLGGKVDFGIYERHLAAAPSLGIAVFVQHGASTIKDRGDFKKMPIGGVGEVHLATEYQKITLGIIARMMPDLAEKMAQYLEDLMVTYPDTYGKKFGEKWAQAFNDSAQQGKSRRDIIVEILADELPGKLAGSLKDLTKELSGPFKNEIWNAPAPVREAMRQALYKEFSEIFQMLGARETQELVESIIPVAKQPVVLAQHPEVLTQTIAANLTNRTRHEL